MCLQSGQTSALWISLRSIFFRLNDLGEFQLKHFSTGCSSIYFSSLLPMKFWSREDGRWWKHVPFALTAFPVAIQQWGGNGGCCRVEREAWRGDGGTRACGGLLQGTEDTREPEFENKKGFTTQLKHACKRKAKLRLCRQLLSIFFPNFL